MFGSAGPRPFTQRSASPGLGAQSAQSPIARFLAQRRGAAQAGLGAPHPAVPPRQGVGAAQPMDPASGSLMDRLAAFRSRMQNARPQAPAAPKSAGILDFIRSAGLEADARQKARDAETDAEKAKKAAAYAKMTEDQRNSSGVANPQRDWLKERGFTSGTDFHSNIWSR